MASKDDKATDKATGKGKGKDDKATSAGGEAEGGKGSRKKLLLIAAPAALAVLALVWFFFLSGPSEEEKKEAAKPKPGEVVKIDPIHINLADGHFLKLGLALQATENAHEPPDGSKALDLAIALFSGKEVTEINSGKHREEAKKHLLKEVGEAYEGEVMDVYFTEFVTQ